MKNYQAHTPGEEWHNLEDHTLAVAKLSSEFSKLPKISYFIALLHDIGKASERFQTYLQQCFKGHHPNSVGHKNEGTSISSLYDPSGVSSQIINGHHMGMKDRNVLPEEVRKYTPSNVDTYMKILAPYVPEIIEGAKELKEELKKYEQDEQDILTRVLFSSLVDADYLDTSNHYNKRYVSPQYDSLPQLLKKYRDNHNKIINQPKSKLLSTRQGIYRACIAGARQEPGIFTLTAPCGSGKTQSSLAFALHHAINHKMDHVIYATSSVTDQVAKEFNDIFGISCLEYGFDLDERNSLLRQRRDFNWEAPVVVTSIGVLLKSLFSSSSFRCRKVHNIVNSVIIIEEAQTIPIKHWEATMKMFENITKHFNCTIVLCTEIKAISNRIKAREILPNVEKLFDGPRKEYKLYPKLWDSEDIAKKVQNLDNALVCVNTRAKAIEIYDLIQSDHKYLLTVNMCSAHRLGILEKLKEGPRILVTTSLVEGMDFHFSVAYREITSIEEVLFTLGRCDALHVFDMEAIRKGTYAENYKKFKTWLSKVDIQDQESLAKYFNDTFKNTDEKGILGKMRNHAMRNIDLNYNLLPYTLVPVIVPYKENVSGLAGSLLRCRNLISRKNADMITSHIVLIPENTAMHLKNLGYLRLVFDEADLYQWRGGYSEEYGLMEEPMTRGKRIFNKTFHPKKTRR